MRKSEPSSRRCVAKGVVEGVAGGMLGEPPIVTAALTILEDWRIGAMTETGCLCVDSGERTGAPACFGSGELSLTDPMGPPPSIRAGKSNGPKILPAFSTYQEAPQTHHPLIGGS